jgi:hypothetical protein
LLEKWSFIALKPAQGVNFKMNCQGIIINPKEDAGRAALL